MLDQELYKAAKRVAVDRDRPLSEMLNKGLLVYVSDPEGVEETTEVLTDKKAMAALFEGIAARAKGRRGYYVDWARRSTSTTSSTAGRSTGTEA